MRLSIANAAFRAGNGHIRDYCEPAVSARILNGRSVPSMPVLFTLPYPLVRRVVVILQQDILYDNAGHKGPLRPKALYTPSLFTP